MLVPEFQPAGDNGGLAALFQIASTNPPAGALFSTLIMQPGEATAPAAEAATLDPCAQSCPRRDRDEPREKSM